LRRRGCRRFKTAAIFVVVISHSGPLALGPILALERAAPGRDR